MSSFSRFYLGGSTLGWSANERNSFHILDYFHENGGNCIDTSDFYSEWVPGNPIGVSEEIIGKWISKYGNREKIFVASKVGLSKNRVGLSKNNIFGALHDSLRRLNTEYLDSYLSHLEVTDKDLPEFVLAMCQLRDQGKIKSIGLSHNSIDAVIKVHNALISESGKGLGLVQLNFNLVERDAENWSWRVNELEGVEVLGARPLASGFLSGKYRRNGMLRDFEVLIGIAGHFRSRGLVALSRGYRSSLPADAASKYFNPSNLELIVNLRQVSRDFGISVSELAVAWCLSKDWISKVVMSFRKTSQLRELRELDQIPRAAIEKINHLFAVRN